MNKIEQLVTLRMAVLEVRAIYTGRYFGETQAKIDAWRVYHKWLHAMKLERVRAIECADLIFEGEESRMHYTWLLGYDPYATKNHPRTSKAPKNFHNPQK